VLKSRVKRRLDLCQIQLVLVLFEGRSVFGDDHRLRVAQHGRRISLQHLQRQRAKLRPAEIVTGRPLEILAG